MRAPWDIAGETPARRVSRLVMVIVAMICMLAIPFPFVALYLHLRGVQSTFEEDSGAVVVAQAAPGAYAVGAAIGLVLAGSVFLLLSWRAAMSHRRR